jgi:hypothetical protein
LPTIALAYNSFYFNVLHAKKIKYANSAPLTARGARDSPSKRNSVCSHSFFIIFLNGYVGVRRVPFDFRIKAGNNLEKERVKSAILVKSGYA